MRAEQPYSNLDIHDFPEIDKRFPHMGNLSSEELVTALELAKTTIGIAALVEEVKRLERIPKGADGRRENVAEHSFMVALSALEAVKILKLEVDTTKILAYALCHDLLELETGDTNTFSLTPEELAEKELREQAALEVLLQRLPDQAATYVAAYEQGEDFEAKLVRVIDKLAPIAVNIAGGRMDVILEDLEVFHPDTFADVHDQLNERYSNKFGADFPVIVAAHGLEAVILERRMETDLGAILAAEFQRNPSEVERKFLVNLADLEGVDLDSPEIKKKHLRQFYVVSEENGSEIRVRSVDDAVFQQTEKSAGTIQRKEVTIPLKHMTPKVFDVAFEEKGVGNIIDKTRYVIPIEDGKVVELDIYHGVLGGLVTAEVEFKGRDALLKAKTWTPEQPWLNYEVTEDGRFKNKNLAFANDVQALLSEAT